MIVISELNIKKLLDKLEAVERAWDALDTSENKNAQTLLEINSALVLSADRVELVYKQLNRCDADVKASPASAVGVTFDDWLQRAIELADELGEAVPAIFREVEQREVMTPWLAEALSESYMLAGLASASMAYHDIGNGAIAAANRLKLKLNDINKEILGITDATVNFAKARREA